MVVTANYLKVTTRILKKRTQSQRITLSRPMTQTQTARMTMALIMSISELAIRHFQLRLRWTLVAFITRQLMRLRMMMKTSVTHPTSLPRTSVAEVLD